MEYRVYLLNKAGHVCAAENFIAANDAEAIEIATAMGSIDFAQPRVGGIAPNVAKLALQVLCE